MDNSIISTPRTHTSELKFWLGWVIASTAAIWISAGVILGILALGKAVSPNINEDRLAGIIMLPITAAILGFCQWLVLRSRIPKSGWWILATLVGIVGGIALAGVAVQVISRIIQQEWYWQYQYRLLMLYVLIGLWVGLTQLPILWHRLKDPLFWLLPSMCGWLALGYIVGVSIDRTSDIFAVGVVPAIFTGLGFIWLRRNPHPEPDLAP